MSSESEESNLEMQESNKEKSNSILPLVNLNLLKDVVEMIAKVAAIIVALCYVVGLLIINSYLRGYGISSTGLLQVDYIMAGALWAFLIAITYFLLLTAVVVFKQVIVMWKQPVRKRVSAILLALFAVLGPASSGAFIIMVLSAFNLTYGLEVWSILGILLFTILSLKFLYDRFRQSLQIIKPGRVGKAFDSMEKQASIYSIFWWFVIILLTLSTYSRYVYPKLIPAYGGGKTQRAILLTKANQNANLASLGLKIGEDGRSIGPLEVIYEGSDYFVVVPTEGLEPKGNIRAIRISKDIFDAIFYLKS